MIITWLFRQNIQMMWWRSGKSFTRWSTLCLRRWQKFSHTHLCKGVNGEHRAFERGGAEKERSDPDSALGEARPLAVLPQHLRLLHQRFQLGEAAQVCVEPWDWHCPGNLQTNNLHNFVVILKILFSLRSNSALASLTMGMSSWVWTELE